MSEENGSADAGNLGASTPAGDNTGDNPNPCAASGTGSPETTSKTDWLSGIEDPDLRGYAETKGFDKAGVENVLKSYQNLEKVFGADKADRTVMLPGPDADADTMSAFFNRLGRPEEPTGYELPVPEGDDGKMAEWARGVFHEAGLTPKQAVMLSEKWNEHLASLNEGHQQQTKAAADKAEADLKAEWGAAYDQKVNGIEEAARRLDMSEADLVGLRSSMGPAAAMKFVDGLASRLGEAVIDTGGQNGTGDVLTPKAAHEELSKLAMDKEFMEAWLNKQHPSHNWAVEKKQNLAKMAAGHT